MILMKTIVIAMESTIYWTVPASLLTLYLILKQFYKLGSYFTEKKTEAQKR